MTPPPSKASRIVRLAARLSCGSEVSGEGLDGGVEESGERVAQSVPSEAWLPEVADKEVVADGEGAGWDAWGVLN